MDQSFDAIGSADLFPARGREALPATLSKKAFAKLLGVSQARISQLIASGLPLQPNGRIDPREGRAWIVANTDPNRRRIDAEPEERGYVTPRARLEAAQAEIMQLKAEKLAGSLIDRKAALRAIEGRARAERDSWIGWVNRAAPAIAARIGGDIGPIVTELDRLVREQLTALATMEIDGLDR